MFDLSDEEKRELREWMEDAIRELKEHNSEYKHITSAEFIKTGIRILMRLLYC